MDMETPSPCLFESDATAIRTFVREMVTQSIVPHMESRVSFWNDQVASKRRGISGRFMSMSKRWTGFGSSSRSSSGIGAGSGSGSSGNFDSVQGFYRPDTPEAVLRKMADYAFMLRDWKLSTSTYELLRTDFGNDKAWKYLAGANEMSAISTLLNPQTGTVKTKLETIDQMLETASYSYLTRCSDTQNTLRCLILAVELLKIRGGPAAEDGAKWAIRVLELGLTGAVGQVLVTERVAACYASKIGAGTGGWGSRKRKATLWTVLAADGWLRLGKTSAARAALDTADRYYGSVLKTGYGHGFGDMRAFLEGLRHALKVQTLANDGADGLDGPVDVDHLLAEETSEKLDLRQHRKSLIGASNPLEAPPLSPIRGRQEAFTRDDDFE
jgi:trafficking protein particle complex subunit 8